MQSNDAKFQPHLRIFEDRSEYYAEDGYHEVFKEGINSTAAKKRAKKIRDKFADNFLEHLIKSLNKEKSIDTSQISDTAFDCVNMLVDSLTSEVGRALIGISIVQLCIKTIEPEQNIRLHKSSSNPASFSWIEGISMRTLDKNHITPTLRKYNLLKLNADGFMMTRSLAENYPYTFLYKAYIKGARKDWLLLVDEIEKRNTSPLETLKYLLSKLISASSDLQNEAEILLALVKQHIDAFSNREIVVDTLSQHSKQSTYAARLLEIAMHSLIQSAVETGAFGGVEVKPLSQMRSANKKHGNIGDVELLENDQIIEAWDAKYGKSYLREELEEIIDKISKHNHIRKIGFVTDTKIHVTDEVSNRIYEIKQLYLIDIKIISFDEWVNIIFDEVVSNGFASEMSLSKTWLMTYCEYLSQKKRNHAPIDEPCIDWIRLLIKIIKNKFQY